VRPSRNGGLKCSMMRRYVGAGRVMELVDHDQSKWSGLQRDRERPSDCTDANTTSASGVRSFPVKSPASHPGMTFRKTSRLWRRISSRCATNSTRWAPVSRAWECGEPCLAQARSEHDKPGSMAPRSQSMRSLRAPPPGSVVEQHELPVPAVLLKAQLVRWRLPTPEHAVGKSAATRE